ncbi:MAG: endonuclease [Pseudonocardia sp.]|nr:endonuclease [Pseudonocardia sp.]
MSDAYSTVEALLETAGRTYAAEAGITLDDKPAPLYRLLVLATLPSTRVQADLAVAATREPVSSGMGTPEKMRDARQQRVEAMDRANYTRVDEQMSTALGEAAEIVLDRYRGDLRGLRAEADGDPGKVRELLTAFPRLGPVGADIFTREAQALWPELRPTVDGKALDGARRLGLPEDEKALADLVPDDRLAEFSAALTRVALDRKLAEKVTGS